MHGGCGCLEVISLLMLIIRQLVGEQARKARQGVERLVAEEAEGAPAKAEIRLMPAFSGLRYALHAILSTIQELVQGADGSTERCRRTMGQCLIMGGAEDAERGVGPEQ